MEFGIHMVRGVTGFSQGEAKRATRRALPLISMFLDSLFSRMFLALFGFLVLSALDPYRSRLLPLRSDRS
jgi:hypothetical protein